MKIKPGFILRTVAGETVALPTDGVANLDMMISLNETGRFLWERLTDGAEVEELVAALLAEYDVDADTARTATLQFIEKLQEHRFLV